MEVIGERRSLGGAEEVSVLFGAFTWRPSGATPGTFQERYLSSGEVVAQYQKMVAEFVAGFIGMMTAIIVTAQNYIDTNAVLRGARNRVRNSSLLLIACPDTRSRMADWR